jgi:hypothetical protein
MEKDAQPGSDQQDEWARNTNPEWDSTGNPTEAAPEGGPKTAAGREMLVQLQQMIDTIATQAGPVMRDVAVKAAELAAVAGQKAGPLAYKAAEVTETLGQKMATRSKEFAAEMRRSPAEGAPQSDAAPESPSTEATTAAPESDQENRPATDNSTWS